MTPVLTMILPALVPAIADGLRGLFARLVGGAGAQPQSVAESIQLMQAQTARVEALAKLDALSPGASQWVADFRGSFRYFAVGGVIASTIAAVFAEVGPVPLAVLMEMSGASMSFVIGERMYLKIKQ